jgi:TRAP-type transport system small permease protein
MSAESSRTEPPPRWEERLMVACMAALVVITLINVLTRYLTDDSFAWTEEFSVALMVVMTLAGASAVAFRDRHIRIEFFFNRKTVDGNDEPRRGLQRFGLILSGLFFVLMALLFTRLVWDQIRFAETSMGLGIPLWWYSAVIPPICLVIAWRCLARLRKLLSTE